MQYCTFAQYVCPVNERTSCSRQVWDSTEAVAHTAKFANVHMALSVYRNKLMAEAAATGAPLMRTLFLHYPNDPAVATLSHEFLLGRDMLVSPVLDLNVSKVRLERKLTFLHVGCWQLTC